MSVNSIPSCTTSGSGSQLTTLERTVVPSLVSTMADTYGAGIPGAARCTIVNALSLAALSTGTLRNSRRPHLAQALRRSKKRAPQFVHSFATRWGREPSCR